MKLFFKSLLNRSKKLLTLIDKELKELGANAGSAMRK